MKDRDQKDGFILYKSFYGPISTLTDDQLGRLFRAIFKWQIDGTAQTETDIQMAFLFIVNQFRIDNNKYQERCDTNRKNIQSRWEREKKCSNEYGRIQSKHANSKHSDNDNEKDDVKERKRKKSSLTLPFSDQKFIDTWNELRSQPKWKSKTVTALQKSLDKLSRYDVRFAIELMNKAIENGYQGVVYDDAPSRYEQWMKSHPQPQSDQGDGHGQGDIYSAYDFD